MSETRENKMGTMPVNRLLITMSLPIILSMLVQALYNIVDSIFVAKYSANALTAVTMAFPAQSLMIALATGTGVGVNALLSYNLGRRDSKGVNEAATHGIFLAACSAVIFMLLGIFFSHTFYAAQFSAADASTNPAQMAEIIKFGEDYISVVTICCIALFMQVTLERLLQATGKTLYSMITQVTGAVINICLDYVFVFGKCGLPAMGARGAAIATIFGQSIATCMAIYFNVAKNKEISLSFKGFRVRKNVVTSIYKVGLPTIIMQSIGSVVTFILNNLLLEFSKVAVDVLGIYFKIQSFIFMPVFGLNNGMIPIVAYNYGAQRRKRITQTIKLSYLIAFSIMTIGAIVFFVFPEPLLSMFAADEAALASLSEIGVTAFRVICVHFPVAAFSIITISVFQALGNGFYSMIVSICRQLVILLPVAYIMAKVVKNLDLVWSCYPIAEIASATMCAVFLVRTYKQKLQNLPE